MQDQPRVGRQRAINPLAAMIFASPFSLFLGAVLCNWAYASTYQIQWTNFASWLVAGGLVFVGAALAWALVKALLHRSKLNWIVVILAAATFVAGLLTALVLARDAWAAMPESQILCVLTLVLATAANWVALSNWTAPERTR